MKNIFLTTLMSCFLLTFGIAQLDRTVAPTPGPAPKINIPKSDIFKLDNGLTVIVSSNRKQPKVSFNLVVSSDPRLEGNKTGLSDLTGELLLSGTTSRDKDQLDNEKDFIGATLAASNDNVYMSCLTKHMDKGLTLMLDVIKNASFPESEFTRVKKQYESSLANVSTDANTMAQNATVKSVFPNKHPYGEVMTMETLNTISREDVLNFYKEQFTPNGSYLVIVGDIDLPKAKEVVNSYFSDWSGKAPYEASYNTGNFSSENKVIFVEKPGAVQSVVTIAFPIEMTPGHEDQIKLTVLNKIIGGGGFGTRLMQNLREDKAYTYGAYSRLNVNREGSWISASGSFRNEVTDSTITEFVYEFSRITEDMVTEEELELNKASLAGSFARSLESPRTIANFALNTFRNDLPEDYYQTYLKKLNAVTKEDVLAVAKKYITPNSLNIIVVGNEEVIPNILQFDANGKVKRLDAFGNPYKKKTYEKADISKEAVIENYLMAVTQSKNIDKANKKIEKITSVQQIVTLKPQQAPVELTMKSYFEAPFKRAMKLEMTGMVLQQEIFNGSEGMSKQMNQTGGHDITEFSEEEIEIRKKTSGLFPELALQCNGIEYTLLGIDLVNNKKCYVIEYKTYDATVKNFYDVETFMKVQTETLTITDEGPVPSNATFSDYRAHKSILFPYKTTRMAGSAVIEANVKEILINKKIDANVFSF